MTRAIFKLGALREQVAAWKRDGLRVGFVPTMGALHAGHVSLIELALRHSDRVVCSIYVNPAQFGEGEDLDAYPRTEDSDMEKLRAAGCHAAYMPSNLYPEGFATRVEVDGHTAELEGPHRPGHFEGVALVLTKLFNRVEPDVAVFGEKDFQQLALVRRLVADLDFPIEVVGAPIARDEAGLALSSRNAYFDKAQLEVARGLNRVLRECVKELEAGKDTATVLAEAGAELLAAGFERVDYLELRDAETLGAVTETAREGRLLAVARLEGVRLLDNFAVELPKRQSPT